MLILVGERRWVRFLTFTSLYVAQGIPIGLLDVAMPAWMAQAGFNNADVAGFVAVVSLPWAFKLFAGPLMDRFVYPAMGRRRPWVIAAQLGLMLALIALALVPDPLTMLSALMSIGFCVNTFAATQDVAVDGMAIDVVPEHERGKINAFMGFGQVIGYSVFGALSATLIAFAGLFIAACVCAAAVGAILVLMIMTRERTHDAYLPGPARMPEQNVPAVRSMQELLKDLFLVLTTPMSLLILGSIMIERVVAGMLVVVSPLFAVNELGFSAAQFGQFFGLMTGGVAIVGLAIGPLVDQFGGKRILITGMLTSSAALALFGMNEPLWTYLPFFIGTALVYLIASQAVFIGIISQCMNICWAKVAATQFAVYMAMSNLGRSIGARLYGGMSEQLTYADTFLFIAIGMVAAAFVLLFFNEGKQRQRLAAMPGQRSVNP